MKYKITLQDVELESNDLTELVDIAVSEGACPSTPVYVNGISRETISDFIVL